MSELTDDHWTRADKLDALVAIVTILLFVGVVSFEAGKAQAPFLTKVEERIVYRTPLMQFRCIPGEVAEHRQACKSRGKSL